MTPWNLKETYSLVRAVFGHDQEGLARESTRSVNDRKSFASYHFNEAMRLSKAFERRHLAGTRTLLEIHTQGAERKRAAFEVYMIKAGAHSLAAVQSVHAIPDLLAHAIYFGAGQNLRSHAVLEREITLPRVVGALKRDKAFASLVKPLAAVQSGKGWRHLSAVSNMSKHRSVVRSALNEDWTGTRRNYRELYVSSFEHDGTPYPSISLRDLLEPEYDRISIATVGIGNELNHCLRKIAAESGKGGLLARPPHTTTACGSAPGGSRTGSTRRRQA
jgi:hypothetical protein